MRTKNYLSNISLSILNNIALAIVRFVVRTFFIKCLGETLLGVNGLFTNVLSFLSLAELGISMTIGFSLYEPLAKNDEKKISAYMNFYKKIYNIVATVMLVVGIILTPALKYIINEYEEVKKVVPELNYIYFLFILNTVVTYLMSYKRTLITADQKEYKITRIVLLFNVLLGIAQCVVLVLTKNYIMFLITQIVLKILENVACNSLIDKRYRYLKEYKKEKLNREDKSNLYKNIRAIFIHKISDTLVYSTDNIIISKFINVVTVGLYSNYLLISTSIKNFVSSFFWNLTASFGNLLVTENDEKKNEIFNVINFIAFFVFGSCALILYGVFNPLIEVWIGEKYLLGNVVVLLIAIEFFVYGMSVPISVVKSSAGLYKEDKYIPIFTAMINLGVSIALVKPLGLSGVLIGTIACAVLLPIWYKPILVYKHVLHGDLKLYYRHLLEYTLVYILNMGMVFIVTKIQISEFKFLQLLYCLAISSIVALGVPTLIYYKSNEFKYLKEKMVNIKNSIVNKFMKKSNI